jgi:hypothetical protein
MIVRFHNVGQGAVRLRTYPNHQLYFHTRASAVIGLARSWIL